ncbi:MAG: DUF697 domain-containing protein [Cyanobacteria bacterium P01_H01_bin.15]
MVNLLGRKRILWAGIVLGSAWWFSDRLDALNIFNGWSVVALGSVGGWLWWRRRQPVAIKPISLVSSAQVKAQVALLEAELEQLAHENPSFDVAAIQTVIAEIPVYTQRQTLKIALLGGKQSGKTSLLSLLSVQFAQYRFIEIATPSDKRLLDVDLVLWTAAGDLTASQQSELIELVQARHRIVLVFNKQDRYVPEERIEILDQLRQHVASFNSDLVAQPVAISTQPNPMTVRRHQSDGTVEETLEPQAPEIRQLTTDIEKLLARESTALVWNTLSRQITQFRQQVRQGLNAVRRDQALPIIEQYQCLVGVAAFANPVATLDLLAAATINTQMLADLGNLYHHKFSANQAEVAAKSMGALLIKLGLVELSSQAIATVLKTNAVTYAAGGLLQGVTAAYWTRLVGISLIDYFEVADPEQTEINWTQFGQQLQAVFQKTQAAGLLNRLAVQMSSRFEGAVVTER